MIFYGLEEKADAMIETLTLEKDPILRYGASSSILPTKFLSFNEVGAMFTVGLAYCGTANNKAVKRLLYPPLLASPSLLISLSQSHRCLRRF